MGHILDKNKNLHLARVYKKIADFLTPLKHDYKKWERKNRWLRRAGIEIGRNVAIGRGFFVLDGCEENLIVRDFVALGKEAKFWAFGQIEIGRFCMFAAEVSLTNGGHDKGDLSPYASKLTIGNGVWVGHRATIVAREQGLKIGDNAIIGGGALVIDDVPENAIVAGVPAKVIGYRELPKKVWHLGNDYFCPQTFRLIDGIDNADDMVKANREINEIDVIKEIAKERLDLINTLHAENEKRLEIIKRLEEELKKK